MTQEEIICLALSVVPEEDRKAAQHGDILMLTFNEVVQFFKLITEAEREACESIEYDLAKSPAMFATLAEYKSYRDGVEKYRAAIRARGQQ